MLTAKSRLTAKKSLVLQDLVPDEPKPIDCVIVITDSILTICNHRFVDVKGYDVSEVSGYQVCFRGRIFSINNDTIDTDLTDTTSPLIGHKLSQWFPLEIFLGKREEESVLFTVWNKKISVLCSQTVFAPDAQFFEDNLYQSTQSFAGITIPTLLKPPVSIRSQISMFMIAHERYACSIDRPVINPAYFSSNQIYINQCVEDVDTYVAVTGLCESLADCGLDVGSGSDTDSMGE